MADPDDNKAPRTFADGPELAQFRINSPSQIGDPNKVTLNISDVPPVVGVREGAPVEEYMALREYTLRTVGRLSDKRYLYCDADGDGVFTTAEGKAIEQNEALAREMGEKAVKELRVKIDSCDKAEMPLDSLEEIRKDMDRTVRVKYWKSGGEGDLKAGTQLYETMKQMDLDGSKTISNGEYQYATQREDEILRSQKTPDVKNTFPDPDKFKPKASR